ncbi:MAG: mandelate racemase/muconate lactonizing enzyme family protein [Gammaproteobacteria bacterium]|nr:mandelate racemase/muconate lactonizing enzyme family protein [Gammaproteobacteria bacterium]
MSRAVRIVEVRAIPLSAPTPPAAQISLGIGKSVKRDAVLVRVATEDGLVGWGEAHAARAPTAIAELLGTTIRQLVLGMNAADLTGVWERVYRMQLASHGMGAAAAIALSGLDMALWDLRGKREGRPLYALLGGRPRAMPAYAGGISFGFQPEDALVAEARTAVAAGYRALKLRLGASVEADLAAVRAVRAALGPAIDILADANCSYSPEVAAALLPALDEVGVGWLEEPFPAPDHRAYRALPRSHRTPIAAGENHYLRHDFERLADDGVVSIWQPDLSKCGGITEALRIAALAREHGIAIHPHTSVTGLNVAASLHFLAALPNAGYFEADYSISNPLRTALCAPVATIGADGAFRPPEGPGLGVEIDEEELARHPVRGGAGYV